MMVNAGDRAAIQDYVNRISASLKGIDELQKQEIRAEINSHLIDRCVELTANGAGHPVAEAIAELGDPVVLAALRRLRSTDSIASVQAKKLLRRWQSK